jgi:Chaperone of endosialidase
MKIFRLFVAFALICFALSPTVQAVVPAPDGGYPNFTTAEGTKALQNLTTGSANTAVGWFSLGSLTTGSFNTATGAGSLLFNTADDNTAFGAAALLLNTTGFENTATGAVALLNNTTGDYNTANGYLALANNTNGEDNTATGDAALQSNTTGSVNTAIGGAALSGNTTGTGNIALGYLAGGNLTTGDYNIDIGNVGVVGDANTIRIGGDNQGATFIAGVYGVSVAGLGVAMNSSGQLGTVGSSRRFKKEIKPMGQASEAILALEPVTFHYKKEIDPSGTSQFGLVAEEVEKVNPDLVVRDKEGKPYSVRYDQVNAMLLNEFLKEHRKVEEQQNEIDVLRAELKEQRALIQKVTDKVELAKPVPQTVLNNQ